MIRFAVPVALVLSFPLTACKNPGGGTPSFEPPTLQQGKYTRAAQPPEGGDTSRTRPGRLPKEFASGELRVARLGDAQPNQPLELPLEHTDVKIRVSGFVARAVVTQKYKNPFEKPIEAIYTFPLPADAAVDAMTMKIGERTIRGEIKKRDEARRIYEEARAAGQRASLLEQERPNIFTQSVANIMPGDAIEIVIEYVDILAYTDGAYELVFPLVVGPRYIPGKAIGKDGEGTAPDTDRVPDASRITPPVLAPGQRSGHDVSVAVELDAGVIVQGLYSTSHALDIWDLSPTQRRVNLSSGDIIPNKDFVLRYQTAGPAPQVAVIPYHDERGGFFTLLIQPQREVADDQAVPRELIFIVDTSGSMRGFPLDKSKEAMRRLIRNMRSTDRFNIIRFAGDTGALYDSPKSYDASTAEEAISFVDSFRGGGGTEMAKGIVEALRQPAARGYLRIAILLTDGYVSEDDVFGSINAERRGARVFTFGVGSSPNRYLLDRAAILGRGEAFYVRQDEHAEEVISKFFHRVDRPALANIELDWAGLDVTNTYPERIPDLFAGQPLRIHGRYDQGGAATILVKGQLGSDTYEQSVAIDLPREKTTHEAMASVWARQKIKDLVLRMYKERDKKAALEEEITNTGLAFRLMTKYTSFVAVEEKVVNVDGKPETVLQPVELPDGVDYEGVFGPQAMPALGTTGSGFSGFRRSPGMMAPSAKPMRPRSMMKIAKPSRPLPPRATSTGRAKSEVMKIFQRHQVVLRRCFEKALQSQPKLAGKIVFGVVIAQDGKVKLARIKSTTLKDKPLESCLLAKIRLMRFAPAAAAGDFEVELPLILKADK